MIDILLATYNGGAYLKEQLESIAAQSVTNWRLLVGDDGSEDETVAIAKAFQKKFPKGQVSLYSKESKGQGAKGNFIRLCREATSDYVMFCDQDDVWHPDKISKTLIRLKQMERQYTKAVPLLVFTDLVVVDQQLKELSPSFITYMNLPRKITMNRLLIQNSITGCTVMMNKCLCDHLKQVEDVDRILMHDHFAAMIACGLGRLNFLPEATIDYRQHEHNSVGAADANSLRYLFYRMKRGREKFFNDMKNSMDQAGYFYQLYKDEIVSRECSKLVCAYAKLHRKNKFYRMVFYIRNKVLKYGWLRAIMQILWG